MCMPHFRADPSMEQFATAGSKGYSRQRCIRPQIDQIDVSVRVCCAPLVDKGARGSVLLQANGSGCLIV